MILNGKSGPRKLRTLPTAKPAQPELGGISGSGGCAGTDEQEPQPGNRLAFGKSGEKMGKK